MTCATCRFSQIAPSRGAYECRAHPPVATAGAYHVYGGTFPKVFADDWCGEYESEDAVMRAAEKCL